MKRYGVISVLLLVPAALDAQRDRIAGPIDRDRTVTISGHVSPIARAEYDIGAVDPAQKLTLLTLMLKPSDEQQAQLDQLLVDQQDPYSPQYHQWLTPEQYADRFGASAADMDTVVSWLRSEGFQVDDISRGRSWVVFSGSAGQVKNTFRTELRRYKIGDEVHFANNTDPSVPAALQPLVRGFLGFDDIAPQAHGHSFRPDFTSGGGSHYLAPDDLATIYDLNPLLNAGINGTGQKIAIAGRTDVALSDIASFRTKYNLPDPTAKNLLQFVLVPGSADPGTTADLDEADLDITVSGEIARNATIVYVYSTNIYNSVLHVINNNVAPVLSYSYGICEPKLSSGTSSNLQAAAQQGNAQGITWVASSGDSGAAECDKAFSKTNAQATQGQYPSFPTTIPEVTGVGGTQFNEGGGNYWGSSNSSHGGSALGYIPEIAWNENSGGGIASTGGGVSTFYQKPTWQTGPGVPAQNARTAPDVALSAAIHDGYLTFTGGQELIFTGTSAAAPAFAGILGLLNHYQIAKGLQTTSGQGNVNPNIYRLAQSGGNVFHDITASGNTVSCVANTPNCVNGFLGFNAGPGYDLATGWGSIDGNNFITQWNNKLVNTTTAVAAGTTNLGVNSSTTVTATVTAAGSAAAPTGSVSFNSGNTALGSANLSNGVASITVFGSQLNTGAVSITAQYSGNANFNASSGSVNITVSLPTRSSAVVPTIVPNPVYQQQADSDGYSWFYTIRLTEKAGAATTLTGFSINGTNYSSQINQFFGTTAIPAFGTISSNVRTRGLTVPTNVVFAFSTADGGQQQISVPFYGPQITASMALSGIPPTIRQNPAETQDCQWFQHVGLQEQNGHSVKLTKFLAGGFDLSDQIADFFGATVLPGLGSLLAGVCWSGVTPIPQTKTYEIDGIDDTGANITATLSAVFDVPQNTGALSTSPQDFLTLAVPSMGLAKTAKMSVNVPAGQPWTISIFPSNRTTQWLTVFPQSGTGPATVTVLADSTSLANGLYFANLVFQSINTVPQFQEVEVDFSTGPGSGIPPTLSVGGVLNAASFAVNNAPISAGSLVSIFGSNLALVPLGASSLPLQTVFNGANVYFDGIPAPLLFVSGGQINAQVPYGVVGDTVDVQASTVDGFSNVITVNLAQAAPGIISQTQNGQGAGVIVNATTFALVTPSNPIPRGTVITIFAVGLGPVSFQPASGAPSPVAPLSQSTNQVVASIGGLTVAPLFSGLTPGFVGLFQVNLVVPQNSPTGSAIPVTVTASGVTSNTVTMAIR